MESRINEFQKLHGILKKENGWATISVVFEKKVGREISIPFAEIFSYSEKVICYLLKENHLSVSLRQLFDHYNRV